MKIHGQGALIPGAGSDIGEAIARRYAEDGAMVYVPGHRAVNIGQVATLIRAYGGQGFNRVLDVSDSLAVAATVQAIIAQFGLRYILVANTALAGMSAYLRFMTDVSNEQWNRIFGVDLSGILFVRAKRHES
jgi:NAD(P)-dependent dehydrogenase (short-subunit alcohol dehydrogenase family)